MTNFKTDSRFEFIDENSDSWYCKIDDEFQPNREEFVEREFMAAYSEALNYDTITKLVSRSESLRDWYATVIEKYILEVDVPQYYSELIGADKYKEVQKSVSAYNKLNKDRSMELSRAADVYKSTINNINIKYRPKFISLEQDNVVKILTLTSDKLPLALQLRLENYSPQDKSDPRTKSLYAREMLVRYKRFLLQEAEKGERTIDEVIEEGMTKF